MVGSRDGGSRGDGVKGVVEVKGSWGLGVVEVKGVLWNRVRGQRWLEFRVAEI